MARRLGVTPSAVTQACRPGGILHPALVGKGVNALHEAAKAWLDRKAAEPSTAAPIDVAEPDVDTTDEAPKGVRPVHPPSGDEAEAALTPWRAQVDLESLVEPLSTLTERYGSSKEFSDWVKCRKTLEEALKAQMLRERVAGRLIARTTVERMVEKIDEAFRLMLSDAPRSIATRIAPHDMVNTTSVIRDAMEQILQRGKTDMVMVLQADDPLSPLMEAAE